MIALTREDADRLGIPDAIDFVIEIARPQSSSGWRGVPAYPSGIGPNPNSVPAPEPESGATPQLHAS